MTSADSQDSSTQVLRNSLGNSLNCFHADRRENIVLWQVFGKKKKMVTVSLFFDWICIIIILYLISHKDIIIYLPDQLWNSAPFSCLTRWWWTRQKWECTARRSRTGGRAAVRSTFPWHHWQFPPALNAHSDLLASCVPGYQLWLQAEVMEGKGATENKLLK